MVKYTFFGNLGVIVGQRFFRNVLPAKKTADGFSEFAKKIVGLDCIAVPMPEEKSQKSDTTCCRSFPGIEKWF